MMMILSISSVNVKKNIIRNGRDTGLKIFVCKLELKHTDILSYINIKLRRNNKIT